MVWALISEPPDRDTLFPATIVIEPPSPLPSLCAVIFAPSSTTSPGLMMMIEPASPLPVVCAVTAAPSESRTCFASRIVMLPALPLDSARAVISPPPESSTSPPPLIVMLPLFPTPRDATETVPPSRTSRLSRAVSVMSPAFPPSETSISRAFVCAKMPDGLSKLGSAPAMNTRPASMTRSPESPEPAVLAVTWPPLVSSSRPVVSWSAPPSPSKPRAEITDAPFSPPATLIPSRARISSVPALPAPKVRAEISAPFSTSTARASMKSRPPSPVAPRAERAKMPEGASASSFITLPMPSARTTSLARMTSSPDWPFPVVVVRICPPSESSSEPTSRVRFPPAPPFCESVRAPICETTGARSPVDTRTVSASTTRSPPLPLAPTAT